MPMYEYRCRSCETEFETLVQGSTRPVCPHCGSRKLEKKLSVFAVSSTSGKESAADRPGPCGSCPHSGGPGGCGLD